LQQAKIGLKDLSFAETHDCFTIAELGGAAVANYVSILETSIKRGIDLERRCDHVEKSNESRAALVGRGEIASR
jgi:hypothetical protein